MTFYLFIKSGVDAFDIEEEIKTHNYEMALDTWMNQYGHYGFSKGLLEDSIACQNCINKSKSIHCKHE